MRRKGGKKGGGIKKNGDSGRSFVKKHYLCTRIYNTMPEWWNR